MNMLILGMILNLMEQLHFQSVFGVSQIVYHLGLMMVFMPEVVQDKDALGYGVQVVIAIYGCR